MGDFVDPRVTLVWGKQTDDSADLELDGANPSMHWVSLGRIQIFPRAAGRVRSCGSDWTIVAACYANSIVIPAVWYLPSA